MPPIASTKARSRSTFSAGVLPRVGDRDRNALGCRWVAGEEIELVGARRRAAAERSGAQRGVAAHGVEEARGAIGIVAGARGNADADRVGLQFLAAREGGERHAAARHRQRPEVGVVEHVGDDAAHDHRLAHLVLADRGMAGDHMRHLMGEHGGELGGIVRQHDQAARDIERAAGQRECVDRRRIEQDDAILEVRPLGRGDEPLHGLGDQHLQCLRPIYSAIGGDQPLMLAPLIGGQIGGDVVTGGRGLR
jgi:hypothetical protein